MSICIVPDNTIHEPGKCEEYMRAVTDGDTEP